MTKPPDWKAVRAAFPVTERYAYLNNAGVAPLCAPAAAALREFTDESLLYGAARYGRIVKRVEAARSGFARLIGADAGEVAFAANTSDGLSLVANGLDWRPGDRVLLPDHEFPANVYPWLALERFGVKVERIPFSGGRCPPEVLARHLPGARLLSLSAVSFGNGFRFDLDAIGSLCKKEGVLFCVDGIQALGALPLDVKRSGIDFLAADGHKWITGPEGAGGFYVNRTRLAELRPSKVGWRNVRGDLDFSTLDFRFKESAGKFEEGTPNVPGLYGFGAALEFWLGVGIGRVAERIDELTGFLCEELPRLGYKVRSPRGPGEGSGIVSFSGDNGDPVRLREAEKAGVVITLRDGALRASPHAYNDTGDLEQLLGVLRAHPPR